MNRKILTAFIIITVLIVSGISLYFLAPKKVQKEITCYDRAGDHIEVVLDYTRHTRLFSGTYYSGYILVDGVRYDAFGDVWKGKAEGGKTSIPYEFFVKAIDGDHTLIDLLDDIVWVHETVGDTYWIYMMQNDRDFGGHDGSYFGPAQSAEEADAISHAIYLDSVESNTLQQNCGVFIYDSRPCKKKWKIYYFCDKIQKQPTQWNRHERDHIAR